MKQGLLIILSGPSGVGKGTLTKKLKRDHLLDAVFPISLTTRQRRLKETNEKEYRFVSDDDFQKKINNNEFLEYTNYCGHYYGTLKEDVDNAMKEGKNVFLEIETEGAKKVMDMYPGMYTIAIFLVPPTIEELERRIRLRHSESEDQVQKRINLAKKELTCKDHYDTCLTNYTINKTAIRFMQAVNRRIAYIEAVENKTPVPEGYIIKRP